MFRSKKCFDGKVIFTIFKLVSFLSTNPKLTAMSILLNFFSDPSAFLKYGAIGISLALAILSYRLLSKEQDRDIIREPMLKAIKGFLFLALALSIFFGITEIVPKVFGSNTVYAGVNNHQTDSLAMALKNEKELSKTQADALKNYSDKLNVCNDNLRVAPSPFYNKVMTLSGKLPEFGGSITLNYLPAGKDSAGVFDLLNEIYPYLDSVYVKKQLTNTEIIAKWKQLKANYYDRNLDMIQSFDIPKLITSYINFTRE